MKRTIIILLILAGVSLNAIVGDNGVITNAMNAKELSEEVERKENLEYILFDYNSNIASNGGEKSFTNFLSKMKDQGEIEDYIYYSENLIIKYGGYYYEVVQDGDFYKVSKKMTEDLESTGGSLKIVTPDNIQNAKDGNIKFEDGDEFIVLDNVKAEDFNFIIPAGAKVTIKLLGDMTIDNKNTQGKSAIDLGVVKEKDENGLLKYSNGATLDLYIYGNVIVDSSYGVVPPKNYGTGASGGIGANAGIHVPKTAALNLYGTGTLRAYGGKAGDGGQCGKNDTGGRRRSGGAGAGIGGNGGNGGDTERFYGNVGNWIRGQSGMDGEEGESCGAINIYDSISVYAYGGAGGSGGLYTEDAGSSGTGGGGYPGAGIGGRGRWSRCWNAYSRWRRLFSWSLSTMFISDSVSQWKIFI